MSVQQAAGCSATFSTQHPPPPPPPPPVPLWSCLHSVTDLSRKKNAAGAGAAHRTQIMAHLITKLLDLPSACQAASYPPPSATCPPPLTFIFPSSVYSTLHGFLMLTASPPPCPSDRAQPRSCNLWHHACAGHWATPSSPALLASKFQKF